MKRILSLIIIPAIFAGIFASCTDLSQIEQRVDELENRVTAIEAQMKTLNSNVETLQALAEGGIISSVEEKDGVYTITLGDGRTLTLTQGSIGVANAPVVSIDKDGYWMVDYGKGAEHILVGGQKVKAVGADGITPVFGVDAEGCWTVSYDGGKNFERVKGADGNPVKAIPESGIQDKWFDDVKVQDGKLVVVTRDGNTYSLPIVADFICSISNTEDIVLFNAGETKNFTVTMQGVASALVTAPNGWSASLSETTLSVTAPAASTKAVSADSKTDVCILAVSTTGFASISKVKVQLSDAPVVVNPAATVSLESADVNSLIFRVSVIDVTEWKYLCQASSEAAPDAAKIKVDGTVGTASTVTVEGLTAETEYTLYVLPVNGETVGEIAKATGKTQEEPVQEITDLYQAYCDGKDITIAGVVYNKTNNGEAILVNDDTADNVLNTTIKNNGSTGIFFLEDNNNDSFAINAVTEIKGVVLVSRYTDKPVTICPTKFIKLVEKGLVMSNLNIDMTGIDGTTNAGYLMNNSATSDLEYLHIDNCHITNIAKQILATATASCKYAIKNIRIVNSAFEVTGTANIQLFNLYNCSVLSRMQEITFDNNIVYSAEKSVCQAFNWGNSTAQTENVWNTTVSFCNNTFYNTPSGNGHFKFYQVGSLKCEKNIYCADTDHDQASYMFILYSEGQTGENIVVADNLAYGLADGKNWTMFHSNSKYKLESGNVLTKLEASPLSSVDVATGKFVPTSEYSSYGAQR